MITYYLLGLNSALLMFLVATAIAIYMIKAYNIHPSANYTAAPARVDTIELKIPRDSVNSSRNLLIRSGYRVAKCNYADGFITLTMVKPIGYTI